MKISMHEIGYRRIKSTEHAMQLMRREIKQSYKHKQRNKTRFVTRPELLLHIRVGAWYRFSSYSGCKHLTIIPASRTDE